MTRPRASGSLPIEAAAGARQRGRSASANIPKGVPPPSVSADITAGELAALLGLSTRSIRELASKGVLDRDGRGRYAMAEAVQSYCRHLRDMAAGRGSDGQSGLTDARARQAREQADHLSLKNAALRRELIPAIEVETRLVGVFRKVRAGLLAAPGRVQQRLPHMTAADIAILDREIRDVLTELGHE